MQDVVFRVPIFFEYAATLTWALSGAVVGVRKGYDITGVFVISLLSSFGAGLVRDAVFLQRTPVFLVNPIYLPLVAGATLFTALFAVPLTRWVKAETSKKLVDVIDAVGTPAFAIVGMQLAEERQLPLHSVLFIGVVNGTAGGLLRDVVVRDVPTLLRPGQFVSLALLIVCGLFLVLTRQYGFSPTQAGWWTVGSYFVIRILAVRFNWRTRSVASGTIPLDVSGQTPADDDDQS